jgi:hypothetical protein
MNTKCVCGAKRIFEPITSARLKVLDVDLNADAQPGIFPYVGRK